MGQKVNPFGFRLGYIKKWHSTWYSKDKYADTLHEDLSIRTYIEKKMKKDCLILLLKTNYIKLLEKQIIEWGCLNY